MARPRTFRRRTPRDSVQLAYVARQSPDRHASASHFRLVQAFAADGDAEPALADLQRCYTIVPRTAPRFGHRRSRGGVISILPPADLTPCDFRKILLIKLSAIGD